MNYIKIKKEDLEKEYMYKLLKKVLKMEFPWILDIELPDDNEINKFWVIFLKFVIDPFKFQEEYNLPIYSYVMMTIKTDYLHHSDKCYMSSPYLGVFFSSKETTYKIGQEIEKTIQSVIESDAIPTEMKLKFKRPLATGSFCIPKNITVPEDVKVTEV